MFLFDKVLVGVGVFINQSPKTIPRAHCRILLFVLRFDCAFEGRRHLWHLEPLLPAAAPSTKKDCPGQRRHHGWKGNSGTGSGGYQGPSAPKIYQLLEG